MAPALASSPASSPPSSAPSTPHKLRSTPVPPSTPSSTAPSTPGAPLPLTPSSDTFPSSPVSPSPASRQRPQMPGRLLDARQRMIARGLYLGDRSIREKVMWVKEGNADILVLRPLEPAKDSQDAGAAKTGDDAVDADDEDATDLPPIPQHLPAVLSLIVKVSESDYYFVPDGNYRGPSDYTSCLADVKLSCHLEKSQIVPADADFSEAFRNLEWIQQETANVKFSKKGLFSPDKKRIKVRHILFERRESDSQDDSVQVSAAFDDENKLSPTFSIEKWPCISDAAKAEIQAMVSSHTVVPIPAYDMHGDLIEPKLYRSRLAGATVEIYFTLKHWAFGNKNIGGNDTYVADLASIRVIAPRPPTPVTPRKRKVALVDPFGEIYEQPSPSKRSKIFPQGMVGMC